MSRVLILFAHPALEKSRVHRRLVQEVPPLAGVTFHDLYEAYPDFDVDIEREQKLLVEHDVFVFQFPFFWYSTPPLVKQWEDLVLEHGWAYGSQGTALRGKRVLSIITTGGREAAYQPDGYNRHTIRQLLAPVEQSARLCGIRVHPPWVVFGTHQMAVPEIERAAVRYRHLIAALHDDAIDFDAVDEAPVLNPVVEGLAEGGGA